MRNRCIAAALAAAFTAGLFAAAPAGAGSGVNVGSLNCKVAGGSGFIFGSTKSLSCLFTRHDGTAERYSGEIKTWQWSDGRWIPDGTRPISMRAGTPEFRAVPGWHCLGLARGIG